MKNTFKLFGIIAFVAIIGFYAISCTGRNSEGNTGGSSARNTPAVKENPASDFSYRLVRNGTGIQITGYSGGGGAVVIPAIIEDFPVVSIGRNTFKGESQRFITSIVIPDSVDLIEGGNDGGAFSHMESLTKVTLPDALKMIGINLFQESRNLVSVNLPTSLERIRYDAFWYCVELSELIIPDSLTSIDFCDLVREGIYSGYDRHFRGCQKLPIRTRQRLQELGYEGNF